MKTKRILSAILSAIVAGSSLALPALAEEKEPATDTVGYNITFDEENKTASVNEEIELTIFKTPELVPVDGTDEENVVTINLVNTDNSIGEALKDAEGNDISPDENGMVTVSFSEEGTYTLAAQGFIDTDVEIISSHCILEITAPAEPLEIEIMHNIAKKFSETGVTSDDNMLWLLADLAVYEELYPDSEYLLSSEQKTVALDTIIADVNTKTAPADFAKAIIALRALGYDAREVYTSTFEKIDVVEKLTALIDAEDVGVTSIYTIPYIITALNQADDYATEEQINYLIDSAISQKSTWNEWGTDGGTAIVLALAPYYGTDEEIDSAIDETIEAVRNAQSDTGAILSFGEDSAASTALAIAAVSALGIDPKSIVKNEKNLIDGLLSQASEDFAGFKPDSNSFSTEQGLRGLLAYKLLEEGKMLFDFSSYPMNKAEATWAENCPVSFDVTPSDAEIEIEGAEIKADGKFDLLAGTYTYSVSKSGYETETGEFSVSEEEAENHIEKVITVTLKEKQSYGGGVTSNDISVNVKIMTHNEDDCDSSFTYKNDSDEFSKLLNETVTIEKGATVFDALVKVLEKNDIDFTEGSSGYITCIDGIEEFDHGAYSGWMFMVDGEHKTTSCRETKLTSDSDVVWFYTDNYTKEKGSVSEPSSSSSSTRKPSSSSNVQIAGAAAAATVVTQPEKTINYKDVNADDWYYEAVKYVSEKKIMNGTDEGFEPDLSMTRAMLVTVLYRLSEDTAEYTENKFLDVADDEWYQDAVLWASANGIVNGVSETSFAPNENVTREQMAAILYRYSGFIGKDTEALADLSDFSDFNQISDWAKDAFSWANENGLINGIDTFTLAPKATATRAQVATILMRFSENLK